MDGQDEQDKENGIEDLKFQKFGFEIPHPVYPVHPC
jgi:hypothetical protein